MQAFIKNTPSWAWVSIFGVLTTSFMVFIELQWPDVQPAWVVALSSALMGLLKLAQVYWPKPAEPTLPPGISAQAAMQEPEKSGSSFLQVLRG